MIEIIFYAIFGLILGIALGLIPGIHPNMIALLLPFVAALDIGSANIIAFATALAVSNTFLDFIPSMLLGAPEPGKELATLPAHRMLAQGNGYDAVKLAVIGGVGAAIFIVIAIPFIVLGMNAAYTAIKPFTYALLIFIVGLIVLSEEKMRGKILAASCFLLAGIIGILSSQVSIDKNFLLFPILTGFFGVSTLLLSPGKISIPKKKKEITLSSRQKKRAAIFGGAGGIFSGLLPGVGASEIATLASTDKNEKSFLMTVGAVSVANSIMALLAIWLISRPRSGIAIFVSQIADVGFGEFLLMISVAIFVVGASALATLKLAKIFVKKIEHADYGMLNKIVIVVIVFLTALFTGPYGMLLLGTCTALGIFANLAGVKRSVLMGVLVLPTIIFYLPF